MKITAIWRAGLMAIALMLGSAVASAQTAEIVASLERIAGRVLVREVTTGREVTGRPGLLLRSGDTVTTEEKSQATIRFRDGSEIRLFPQTTFLIQGAKESQTSERSFKFNFRMRLGALWAHMVPQPQPASLSTPTATIGIKGTTFRVSERDARASVALNEGAVEVKNELSSVELTPGQRLAKITRQDNLPTKVTDIPYKLDLKAEKKELSFTGNRPEEVFVSVQLIEVKTGREVARTGPIYFRSNFDRITYPPAAVLNQRGFVRVPLVIPPPEASDDELNGSIYVWAVVDHEQGDDTGDGRILFTFPVKTGPERIQIESQTGQGRRTN
ncbi:MAG: FecR domain-containing protein [Candidatus Lambdaproteobacteria bacterium]|nr:FecR domain-containing protein [Candidatus Lambdaproteobacteria bacterium]